MKKVVSVIILIILSFLNPLPLLIRDIASKILVFPDPLLPKKILQFELNSMLQEEKFL